jgi:hypothetical protein
VKEPFLVLMVHYFLIYHQLRANPAVSPAVLMTVMISHAIEMKMMSTVLDSLVDSYLITFSCLLTRHIKQTLADPMQS